MLAKRIIPCLDVKDGQTVKGTNFVNLRQAGDPVELGRAYSEAGADELVFLDITASHEGRKTFTDMVTRVAETLSIPFTVGGGIGSVDDVDRMLSAGADKVSVNSAALRRPELIDEIASRFGSQVIVCAIDAKETDGQWETYINGGRIPFGKGLLEWAREAQERGAGEGPRHALGEPLHPHHRLWRSGIDGALPRRVQRRARRRRTGRLGVSLRRDRRAGAQELPEAGRHLREVIIDN